MSSSGIFASTRALNEDEHWISVSDLMAGLMVIFLFVAISYMKDIVVEKERIQKIAITWNETQEALYVDLEKEFKGDLPEWGAEFNKETLSIRFVEPSILFDTAQSDLKAEFQEILNDFFPRYIAVLQQYKGDIAEIRIEGHTSSRWGQSNGLEAYFNNMKLSQDRTRSVLLHCLSLKEIENDIDWAKATITANGLSSSKPVLNTDETENATLSRRVEFRVRTNAERRIVDILQVQ